MSESLRDQLLSAGFTKSVKAKPAQNKRPKTPANRKTRSATDLEQAWAARKVSEKNEQRHKREHKLAEQKRRQAVNQQILKLIDAAKIDTQEGQLTRNFLHHGKIRKIMLKQDQLKQLNAGELAVVFLRGRYFLVTSELALKVAKLSPYHVPSLEGAETDEEAEHPVPDDLSW